MTTPNEIDNNDINLDIITHLLEIYNNYRSGINNFRRLIKEAIIRISKMTLTQRID
jgi:hypothetical protein